MNTFKAYLPLVDWEVYITEISTLEEARDILYNVGCPDSKLCELMNVIRKENTAITYTSSRQHKSVIVIGAVSSILEFCNSLFHELIHLTNHISSALGISNNNESLCTEIGKLSMIVLERKLF